MSTFGSTAHLDSIKRHKNVAEGREDLDSLNLSQILLARGHAWDRLFKPDSADNPVTSQRDSSKSEKRADALQGETTR
ncbi:hypothetical protein M9458_031075, partial [Cirrhinus mrigala]